jgi:UDP-4-amino-4,6-dideoxy-N-acetyl-beta-L-altrosamine N-acetyltransferase
VPLKPLAEGDLEMVLEWRNREDVRRNMFTSHLITAVEHAAWFARISVDPSKRYYVFYDEDQPAGVVGFVDIDERNKHASWGFYVGVPRRGRGSRMLTEAMDLGFEVLGLESLSSEVLKLNEASIRLHDKLGFRVEGRTKAHHAASDGLVEVYRFVIAKSDWLAARR